MTLKIIRAPLLYYFKLCASFHSYRWIQTGVTARKRSIRVKIGDLLSSVTLKFDVWRWKNSRAPILYCFKLYASFHSHRLIQTKVTDRKRWNRVKIGDFFVPCDLEIWRMAPLLCYFKFCASFRRHWWIQLELLSGNAQFGSKSSIFLAVWPWNWTDDLEKQKGTFPKQHQALCIISSSYVNSNWSYSPETAKLGYDLCDLDLWSMTLTLCMDITSVIGNNSC